MNDWPDKYVPAILLTILLIPLVVLMFLGWCVLVIPTLFVPLNSWRGYKRWLENLRLYNQE